MIGFDHCILLCSDSKAFESAVADFAANGFSVSKRDDAPLSPAKSENRLVTFPDGSYIEILNLLSPETRASHRFAGRLAGPSGWVDYSLAVPDIPAVHLNAVSRGLRVGPVSDYSRQLSNGQTWGVTMMIAGPGVAAPYLPFFLTDQYPHELRVPPPVGAQPEGATGIEGVLVVSTDAARSARDLLELVPEGRLDVSQDEVGSPLAQVSLGSQWVAFQEPSVGTELRTCLDTFGETVAEVVLRGRNPRPASSFVWPSLPGFRLSIAG